MAKTELAIPPVAIADPPAEAQQGVRRYQAKAQAANTSRAYAVQLRFKAWCKREGYSDTPPVAPAIVTRSLLERADAGASRSTLAVALAAIKAGHRAAKQRFDAADPCRGPAWRAARSRATAAPGRASAAGDSG